jgi:hypothetical protein
LSQKRQIFRRFYWQKKLKIITSVPACSYLELAAQLIAEERMTRGDPAVMQIKTKTD